MPAIVSITVATTLAVPTDAHLPRLIFSASGSAPLGLRGGRKSHPAPPRHDGRSAIATLEMRLANHGVPPRGTLFASTQLPSGRDQIRRPTGVAYQSCDAAAEPFHRDLEGPAGAVPRAIRATNRRPILCRPAPLFQSPTAALDRSAKAKLSMAHGCSERGVHWNDAAVHLADWMLEQTWAKGPAAQLGGQDKSCNDRRHSSLCLHIQKMAPTVALMSPRRAQRDEDVSDSPHHLVGATNKPPDFACDRAR